MELSEAQDDDIKVLADRSDTDGHECILCMLEYYKVHGVIELSKEQIKNFVKGVIDDDHKRRNCCIQHINQTNERHIRKETQRLRTNHH